MSLLKAIKAQLGLSNTPTNNFLFDASADNGTMKLQRGNGQDILTVDANGVVHAPRNVVAFDYYSIADQVVSNNVVTKVMLPTKNFDTTNAFDTVTNRFQPTVGGYYQINVRGRALANPISNFNLFLQKNGAINIRLVEALNSITASGSTIVYLNGTTDYLELWALVNGAGTCSLTVAADTTGQYGPRFSGYLLGAA